MPVIGGVYSGTTYYAEPATQAGGIAIDQLVAQQMARPSGANSIVAITMAPTAFATNQNTPEVKGVTISKPSTIGGITPRNKKLLTYPYCYLIVDCLNDSQEYRYERFKQSNCVFRACGVVAGTPNISLTPYSYDKLGMYQYPRQLVMGGYPICSFQVDTYKQWLANNSVYLALSMINAGAQTIAGAASGNGAEEIAGFRQLGQGMATLHVESHRANTARGAVACNVNIADRTKDFYFLKMGLIPEKVKSIDDFFDRYGYAYERVGTPNLQARRNWTYIKTRDCLVRGNLPAVAAKKIADLFNRGITFWRNGSIVGNYSQDNRPW